MNTCNNRGVTYCSDPKSFYWFNPVEVLVGELLAGASIALPSQVTTILNLLRLGSRIMYVFFTAATVINFVLMLASPLVLRTRWFSLALSLIGAISSILVTVATIIATAISFAAKIALTAQDELNISADVGIKMLIFMWIATILTDLAFILHAAMGCCCRPQRGNRSQEEQPTPAMSEKKTTKFSLPSFVRRRKGVSTAEGTASTPEGATSTE